MSMICVYCASSENIDSRADADHDRDVVADPAGHLSAEDLGVEPLGQLQIPHGQRHVVNAGDPVADALHGVSSSCTRTSTASTLIVGGPTRRR
jgi:hypothetical protein